MSFILLGILNAQAAGGGGAGAYDLLESTILTTSASSVSFTGLGSYSDYQHLQIRVTGRFDSPDILGGIVFNGDTGANYARHGLAGNGSSVSSFAVLSETEIGTLFLNSSSDPAGAFGAGVVDILDFSSSSKNTTTRTLTGQIGANRILLVSGLYNLTTAVNSIEVKAITGQYVTGSRFSLYGIKG